MNSRAHAIFVRAAGFCYGLAGFILSVLSAILAVFVTINRKPPVGEVVRRSRLQQARLGSRRRSPIPTITMTGADSDSAVLYAEPSTYGDNFRPPINRSASSPQLTTSPASFLRPPTPEKSRRRKALLRRVATDQVRVRPRTQPYNAPYNISPPNTC